MRVAISNIVQPGHRRIRRVCTTSQTDPDVTCSRSCDQENITKN